MRLADLRKSSGKTQAEVAQAMGVAAIRVSQIERDYPNVRMAVVERYVRALGGAVWFGVGDDLVDAANVTADPARAVARETLRAASTSYVANAGKP